MSDRSCSMWDPSLQISDSSCHMWAWAMLLHSMWDYSSGTGIEPSSPALQGRLLIPGFTREVPRSFSWLYTKHWNCYVIKNTNLQFYKKKPNVFQTNSIILHFPKQYIRTLIRHLPTVNIQVRFLKVPIKMGIQWHLMEVFA